MKKLRILVADDIYINRLLLHEIIIDLGHDCIKAENGKEVLGIIENDDIDLILMDIEMPVMNGIETTKYIREKMTGAKMKIPIIALTAHNPQFFFDDYSNVGFTNLLTKPYSIEKISGIIQNLNI